MHPTQFSSGDVIADRRADYARMLAENGEHEAAVELMEQALELVPGWPAGLVRLADYAEKANQPEKAIPALQRVLALASREPGLRALWAEFDACWPGQRPRCLPLDEQAAQPTGW